MLLLGGSVQVQAEGKIIRDFSRIYYIPAGAVERGQSLDGLREIYDALTCTAYTQDGEELVLPVSWDYSRIDLQKTGAYQITGSVLIPEGYRSEAEIPTWTVGDFCTKSRTAGDTGLFQNARSRPVLLSVGYAERSGYNGNLDSAGRRSLGKCQ